MECDASIFHNNVIYENSDYNFESVSFFYAYGIAVFECSFASFIIMSAPHISR